MAAECARILAPPPPSPNGRASHGAANAHAHADAQTHDEKKAPATAHAFFVEPERHVKLWASLDEVEAVTYFCERLLWHVKAVSDQGMATASASQSTGGPRLAAANNGDAGALQPPPPPSTPPPTVGVPRKQKLRSFVSAVAKVQAQLTVSRLLTVHEDRVGPELAEPYASMRLSLLTTLAVLALYYPVDRSDTSLRAAAEACLGDTLAEAAPVFGVSEWSAYVLRLFAPQAAPSVGASSDNGGDARDTRAETYMPDVAGWTPELRSVAAIFAPSASPEFARMVNAVRQCTNLMIEYRGSVSYGFSSVLLYVWLQDQLARHEGSNQRGSVNLTLGAVVVALKLLNSEFEQKAMCTKPSMIDTTGMMHRMHSEATCLLHMLHRFLSLSAVPDVMLSAALNAVTPFVRRANPTGSCAREACGTIAREIASRGACARRLLALEIPMLFSFSSAKTSEFLSGKHDTAESGNDCADGSKEKEAKKGFPFSNLMKNKAKPSAMTTAASEVDRGVDADDVNIIKCVHVVLNRESRDGMKLYHSVRWMRARTQARSLSIGSATGPATEAGIALTAGQFSPDDLAHARVQLLHSLLEGGGVSKQMSILCAEHASKLKDSDLERILSESLAAAALAEQEGEDGVKAGKMRVQKMREIADFVLNEAGVSLSQRHWTVVRRSGSVERDTRVSKDGTGEGYGADTASESPWALPSLPPLTIEAATHRMGTAPGEWRAPGMVVVDTGPRAPSPAFATNYDHDSNEDAANKRSKTGSPFPETGAAVMLEDTVRRYQYLKYQTTYGSSRPFVRVAIGGGDGTVHAILQGYVYLLAQKRELLDNLDVHFYVLPLGERNQLAQHLAQLDPWYAGHVFAPLQVGVPFVPFHTGRDLRPGGGIGGSDRDRAQSRGRLR